MPFRQISEKKRAFYAVNFTNTPSKKCVLHFFCFWNAHYYLNCPILKRRTCTGCIPPFPLWLQSRRLIAGNNSRMQCMDAPKLQTGHLVKCWSLETSKIKWVIHQIRLKNSFFGLYCQHHLIWISSLQSSSSVCFKLFFWAMQAAELAGYGEVARHSG